MKKALALALMLAPLAIACGKPYQVVRFATPNPFVKPGCKLAVEEIHYDKLMVGDKTVPQYMSEKGGDQQASFQTDMVESSARFVERVKGDNVVISLPQGAAPDNTFILRAFMTEWEPGFYAYVASHKAEMNIVVDVVDSGGNILDEIIVRGTVGAGMEGSGSRMRNLAERLGHHISSYIEDRWLCAAH